MKFDSLLKTKLNVICFELDKSRLNQTKWKNCQQTIEFNLSNYRPNSYPNDYLILPDN